MTTLQIMNSAQSPVYFGTLKLNPADPVTSNYGTVDRFVAIDCGEYGEHRVWFKAGTILDLLQAGDTVMLEFKSNKFRMARQQTPELLATLQGRAQQQTPTATPANSSQQITTHLPAPTSPQQKPPATAVAPSSDSENVELMISIFSRLRRALPNVSDEVIAKLAMTLFIQMSK